MNGYPPSPGANARDRTRFARAEQKAQHKAQRQAQAAAFRAQRMAWRQQRGKLRRSSILGPLLLVCLGIVALALRSGRVPPEIFVSWYGRWWPLLLVAAGLVLLVEWAYDLFLRPEGLRTLPRRAGGGATLLLIALAIAGASAGRFHDGRELFGIPFSLAASDFDEFLGEKHESTKTMDAAFLAGSHLRVDNPHGNVTVIGKSDDGQIHLVLEKQVYSYSDEEAERKAQRLDPQLDLSTGVLAVSIPALTGATADVTITVPASGETAITAHHGSVDISALHAPVSVTANHGDVSCKEITGAIDAHINRNGSSFTAHDIHGAVSVHGHAQDLTLTGIDGSVNLDGEFFGNAHLERVHGPVSFRTKRTQLTLLQLPGALDISPDSELTGSEMIGPTYLRTSSRNISFDRVAGDVSITNSKGSVHVAGSAPLGNINVENRDGAVSLTIPERAGMTLDVSTRGGHIDTDLGLEPVAEGGTQSLQGKVGDGAANVMVRTSHLDVEIHKGKVEPPVVMGSSER